MSFLPPLRLTYKAPQSLARLLSTCISTWFLHFHFCFFFRIQHHIFIFQTCFRLPLPVCCNSSVMAGRALTVAMPAAEKSGKLMQTQILLLQSSDFGDYLEKAAYWLLKVSNICLFQLIFSFQSKYRKQCSALSSLSEFSPFSEITALHENRYGTLGTPPFKNCTIHDYSLKQTQSHTSHPFCQRPSPPQTLSLETRSPVPAAVTT